jgi:hypothetical protein
MAPDESSADPFARAPELQALLRDLDGLRLSLAADLSLAAAAVEAGSPEIAGSVLDSDRAQLQAFEQRALLHLCAAEQEPEPAPEPERFPALAGRARRRSLLTAATPLLAAAAAVLGVLAGVVPTSGGPARPDSTQTAMASYEQVTQLTREGAEAAEVARAAERLHDQLALIVAQASSDPVAAQKALALLESEALVLTGSADRAQLSGVIAEARTLVARLRAALPVAVPVPTLPTPATAAHRVVAPRETPSPPALPATASPRPEPSPEGDRSASPSPSASPSSSSQSPPAESDDEGDHMLPDAVVHQE